MALFQQKEIEIFLSVEVRKSQLNRKVWLKARQLTSRTWSNKLKDRIKGGWGDQQKIESKVISLGLWVELAFQRKLKAQQKYLILHILHKK